MNGAAARRAGSDGDPAADADEGGLVFVAALDDEPVGAALQGARQLVVGVASASRGDRDGTVKCEAEAKRMRNGMDIMLRF